MRVFVPVEDRSVDADAGVLVLDYGTPESMEIIKARAHELAAVVVEPVQSRRPDFQPVEFLRELRQLTLDHGILFVFDDDALRVFWMKNTKIPLDMLFLDADGKLISVQANVPPCVADPCPGYSSGAPARYVLELNAGESEKLGLSSGDPIEIHR